MKEIILFKHYNYLACLLDDGEVIWETFGGTIHKITLDEIRKHMPYNTRDYETLFYYFD
jgi:hypothetical protein